VLEARSVNNGLLISLRQLLGTGNGPKDHVDLT
jgi:hypothetical protein